MQARYYDAIAGRFLSVDPLTMLSTGMNPGYFNRYAYTENDPINAIDPDGKGKLSFFVELVTSGTRKGAQKRVSQEQAQSAIEQGKNITITGKGEARVGKRMAEKAYGKDNVVKHEPHGGNSTNTHFQPANRGRGQNQMTGHVNLGSSTGGIESAVSLSESGLGSNPVTETIDFLNPITDVAMAADVAIGAGAAIDSELGISSSFGDKAKQLGSDILNGADRLREELQSTQMR